MSRTITSPVKRWPGTVTLSDPLSYPQVFAWRNAIETAEKLERKEIFDVNAALIPGILACVEKWELEGVNPSNFPATPPIAAAKLIDWLIVEITKAFSEADEIPLG